MRVLCFCPTHDLFGLTLQSIFQLAWDEPIEFTFTRDNPFGGRQENVIYNYRRGQAIALGGDFDAMLTVESDMVVPAEALARMAATMAEYDAGVVYGLYCWRTGRYAWAAYLEQTDDGSPQCSITDRPEEARAAWGNVREVTGWGLGCTLIRRDVLAGVAWELGDDYYPDHRLACHCNLNGIRQVCDFRVVCGHIVREQMPGIVWPDPEREALYRMELRE